MKKMNQIEKIFEKGILVETAFIIEKSHFIKSEAFKIYFSLYNSTEDEIKNLTIYIGVEKVFPHLKDFYFDLIEIFEEILKAYEIPFFENGFSKRYIPSLLEEKKDLETIFKEIFSISKYIKESFFMDINYTSDFILNIFKRLEVLKNKNYYDIFDFFNLFMKIKNNHRKILYLKSLTQENLEIEEFTDGITLKGLKKMTTIEIKKLKKFVESERIIGKTVSNIEIDSIYNLYVDNFPADKKDIKND